MGDLAMTVRTGVSERSTGVEQDKSEGGYVLIMTALLLIPMLVFAAFAVDVGGWYAQAARTQRASDAAALAAVVWMPDEDRATEAALDVAARNGFVDGVNAEIIVERVGEQQVRVRIKSKGEVYFGAPVMESIDIERFAVAEYVLPVPLGNPTSELGTGDAAGGDGIFLSINGVCMGRTQGDPFSARRFQAEQAEGCNNGTGTYKLGENLNYDSDGYTYVIDVPEGAGVVNVEIKQPGLSCDNYEDDRSDQNGRTGARLNARLYANDATPLSDYDNLEQAPVADVTFSEFACTGGIAGDNEWYSIGQIPASASGRWFLQVRGVDDVITGDSRDRSNGLNDYSLRARKSGTYAKCSSLNDATCPQIYAKDWLSIYRPTFPLTTGAAEFYLAEIGSEHAGKKIEIQLFDAGEGMNNLQILGPNGVAQDFTWEIYTCGMLNTQCTDPQEGVVKNADNCGVPCLATQDSNNNDRFNDKAARILIELPGSYNCFGQSNCWWKIRYTPNSGNNARQPTDRTTWGVAVIGDPVRLIE